MKAVGYVRVSTQEQARYGISIPDQEERIKAYCRSCDLDLTEVIRDPGVSAGIMLARRPGGARLLASGAEHIIALKLDRLFRNTRDCLRCVEEWEGQGKTLHLLDFGGQALNTRTAMGKAFLTVSAAFAELERGLTSERIRNAMERLAIEGKWQGGPLPMGYRYKDPENGDFSVIVDELSAEVVREIFELRAAGNSTGRIAMMLYQQGIRGNQGSRRFPPSSVRMIVRNSSYINERNYRGNIYPAGLPVFLDRSLWDAVRAVDVRQEAVPKGRYILTGLIRCSLCEGPMHHKPAVRGHRACYQCTSRKVWGDCKGVSVSDHIVEPEVLEKFFARVESEGYREAVAKERKPERSVREKISKLEEKQDRLLALYIDSRIDRATLDRRSLELSDRQGKLQRELLSIEADRALPAVWEGDIREDWQYLNVDEKRHALGLFIEKVIVHPGRGRERVEIRWR